MKSRVFITFLRRERPDLPAEGTRHGTAIAVPRHFVDAIAQ